MLSIVRINVVDRPLICCQSSVNRDSYYTLLILDVGAGSEGKRSIQQLVTHSDTAILDHLGGSDDRQTTGINEEKDGDGDDRAVSGKISDSRTGSGTGNGQDVLNIDGVLPEGEEVADVNGVQEVVEVEQEVDEAYKMHEIPEIHDVVPLSPVPEIQDITEGEASVDFTIKLGITLFDDMAQVEVGKEEEEEEAEKDEYDKVRHG